VGPRRALAGTDPKERAHVSRAQDEASSAPFPSQDERRDAQFHPDHLVEPGRHAAINALHQPGNGVFRRRENLLLEHVIQIGEPPAVVIENGDRSLAVGFRPELGVARGFRVEHLVPHDLLSGARIFGLCCRMNATPSAGSADLLRIDGRIRL